MSTRRRQRTRRKPSIPWLTLPFRQLTNPLPPMAWLDEESIMRIHDASMHILEEVGMAFMDDEALDLWETAGAKVDRKTQRVWLQRALVMELISQAPREFTWHARNPAYALTVGNNYLNFAPNSGMPYASDLSGGRRTGTLKDYENFVKLAHTVPFLHFVGGPMVEPQDIAPSLRHLVRTRTTIAHTDRAIRGVAHGRVVTQDILALLKMVYGDPLPTPVTGATINVTSPLRLDDRMIGGLITLARAGQVPVVTPFIMAGATSPITIASALAQQNAEALGGIALAQLVRPGCPVIYGGFTQNIDMRSGSPSFGGPEGAWGIIVGGQLARHYGLPYRSSGSLTNSPTPDAQASLETQWSMWPAVMAHANFVLHSVGWLEGGLVASFEKFVLDCESLGMFYHFLEGFEVDEEALALGAIAEVGIGGHHLSSDLTRANYKDAFYTPATSTRHGYEQWASNNKPDAMQRAHQLYHNLLATYEAPPIDSRILEGLDDYIAIRTEELRGVNLFA